MLVWSHTNLSVVLCLFCTSFLSQHPNCCACSTKATVTTLIPLLAPLVADPESVIRQHLASQLLPLSLVSMVRNVGYGQPYTVAEMLAAASVGVGKGSSSTKPMEKVYDDEGYRVVTTSVINHLKNLITDPDVDVRRSASDSLAGLALHIKKKDVATFILPIALRLANQQVGKNAGGKNKNQQQQQLTEQQETLHEELRITAANLLAELGGAGEYGSIPTELIRDSILPTVLLLCEDGGFRVRRAAAQALPRVLGGASADDAKNRILPAFEALSKDEVYRVRKSTGECLVDMSRSLMIVASKERDPAIANELRRSTLLPIAEALLADANKFVRHGMMQFLGPFLASFYPYVDSALHAILPGNSESDGSNHSGIVAQFFPHASSMVSRLNSSAAATTSAPTPILTNLEMLGARLSEVEKLQQALPQFVKANRSSTVSLKAVVEHRRRHAPDSGDIKAVMGKLLDHFVGLATVSTGDENTDAEMRVYCAYSYPAVVLLLGPENWEGRLKDCLITLLNPNHGASQPPSGDAEGDAAAAAAAAPPLPVKRCLASSLHTIAHVLGPDVAARDIMPIFSDHFLRDTDESVRLNMIRNFPILVSLLPGSSRSQYLLQWCETVRGEEVLGALKRSATNPLVLNWRQRDYVARTLPELICMIDPLFVHTHLWPILKLLLTDSISLVRDDAIWSIPILFKSFCADNVTIEGDKKKNKAAQWSASANQEVVSWLKEAVLRVSSSANNANSANRGSAKGANFSQRQLYCRICATVAMAIRLADGSKQDDPKDPSAELNAKYQKQFSDNPLGSNDFPYQKMTGPERTHLTSVLVNQLLPVALDFKDDAVTNVRLTLLKALHLMPDATVKVAAFQDVVQSLEEEVRTWESFEGLTADQPVPAAPVAPANRAAEESDSKGKKKGAGKKKKGSQDADGSAMATI